MTRQDINQAAAANLVPLRRQRRLYRGAAGQVREGSVLGRARAGASSSTRSATIPPASARPRKARRGSEPNWPVDAQGRADQRARRRLAGDREGDRRQAARPRRRGAAEAPQSDDAIHRATRDSVRALMMIRAYRMRGHLHANLDPLGLEPQKDHEELDPGDLRLRTRATATARSSSTTCSASNPRPCARCWRSCAAPTAARSASSSCTSPIPAEKAWMQERIEGPDKEIHFTKEGKRAILSEAGRGRGLRALPRHQIPRHQALRPRRRRGDDPGAGADHQARRPARREGHRHSAWPTAAGSTCSAR